MKKKFKDKITKLFGIGKCVNKLKYLNEIMLHPSIAKISTVNGKCDKLIIAFKEPIFISLDDLNPVPIYFFNVDLEEDNEATILIGLDIICQYDISITRVNGIPKMTISDVEK